MEYRILGPLEVFDGARPVAVGGGKQRALLAILLLHRNEVVSADRLIEDLWDGAPADHGGANVAGICVATPQGTAQRPSPGTCGGQPPGGRAHDQRARVRAPGAGGRA
jgi:hypothetical protein